MGLQSIGPGDAAASEPLPGATTSSVTRTRFVLLHVPKSAGTALRTVLFDAFLAQGLAPERICPIRDRSLGTLSADQLAAFDVFSGHFYVDQLELIPDPKVVVTLVREPRSRLLSLYNHLRATTWKRIHELEAQGADSPRLAKSLRFADYLRRKDFVVQINADNALTRHLIGIKHMDADGNVRVSDDAALNIAVANLQRLSAVGLVQRSAEFLARVGGLLDLALPAVLPVRNTLLSIVTRNPRFEWVEPVSATDAETEEEILRCTRIDRQIYQHVLRQQPADE